MQNEEKLHPEKGEQKRLYGDLAWLFPIITPLDDYIEETELFVQMMRGHARIPLHTMLHLGCGAGHNDFVFKRHFMVTGADLSRPMLELAKRLNPEVEYFAGDMRSLRINRRFDAVVAIDSLDYLTNEADLAAAFETAAEHLNPGGILFFIVEKTRETFTQNQTLASSHSRDGVDVSFIENLYDQDPDDDAYESTFIYLVRRTGRQEVFIDHHRCGFFPLAAIERLVRAAGFLVTRSTYRPPSSAIEHSGLSGHEEFPLFLCLRPS